MKISEIENAPQRLLDTDIKIVDDAVIYLGIDWSGGTFMDGSVIYLGIDWSGGTFMDGVWDGGILVPCAQNK